MARLPAFLSRSRLAAVSALAVLIACAAAPDEEGIGHAFALVPAEPLAEMTRAMSAPIQEHRRRYASTMHVARDTAVLTVSPKSPRSRRRHNHGEENSL